MGSDDPNYAGAALNVAGGVAYVGQALLGILSAVIGIISSILSSLPLLLVAIAITLVMIPWVRYHDKAIEEFELGMRGTAYPIFRDVIRDVINLLRRIYNPVICWWNAGAWWGYGMVRDVIYPTIKQCGVKPLILALEEFIKDVSVDLIYYLASGHFLTSYADFSRIYVSGPALAQAWINLYTCACSDLGDVIKNMPIIINPLLPFGIVNPIIMMVNLILIPFSAQWTDPQTWCVIGNVFNVGIALLREILRLVQQVFTFLFLNPPIGTPFVRPDFEETLNFLCAAVGCFVRSYENAFQRLWDYVIPFDFVFNKFLCIVDSIVCIALKTANLILRILIHIDECVVYPNNPYWEAVIKVNVMEILNLWAPLTDFPTVNVPEGPAPLRYKISSYWLDTHSQNTPLGVANPLYLKERFTECLCIFIRRLICDPSDVGGSCFSSTAQHLLIGFDFCCLTNTVLVTAMDLLAGLFEFTLHLAKGSDDFFLFVDNQPFTLVLKTNLVKIAQCLTSVLNLIPVVGIALQDLLVGIVDWLLSMAEFLLHVLFGLLTLPYFLIVIPDIPNFLTKVNEAIDYFVAINNKLITDTPHSVKNAACVVLNNGFPIPPIPCSSCQVGGFIQPTSPNVILRRKFFDEVSNTTNSPYSLMREVLGDGGRKNSLVTPLKRYDGNSGNPVELFRNLMENVRKVNPMELFGPEMHSMEALNRFVDQKKQQMQKQLAEHRECRLLHEEKDMLKHTNPTVYERNMLSGRYNCDPTFKLSSISNRQVAGGGEERALPTFGPTEPPVIGCSPTPTCYDLCCIVRTLLILIVDLLNFIARFINGFVQNDKDVLGTMQDFPYFTGEWAMFGKPTFETDFIKVILDIFAPIKCLCQVLNLIIPVTPMAFSPGRPDICCAVQAAGELIASILQVIINAIMALAMGKFEYFTTGEFYRDVGGLFDLTLYLIDCLCILLRAIFPINYIPGFAAFSNFDICCFPQALLVTIIESARFVLQVILSIATITVTPDSFCFWRLDRDANHQCGGTLDEIGFVKQLDVVIDSFLPRHGEQGGACKATCGSDNGDSGIVPCICQVLNTLVPYRTFPDRPVNCSSVPGETNCQELDFCCPFAKAGFVISDALKFSTRALAGLWQSWATGLPEFFINYVFCYEGDVSPCPDDQVTMTNACALQSNKIIPACTGTVPMLDSNNVLQYRCGEFTCGKLNILITDLTDPFQGLIADCTCKFFTLLDDLIALLFYVIKLSGLFPQAGWSCCFCGGKTPDGFCSSSGLNACRPGFGGSGSGILPALSYILTAVLRAAVDLVRLFPYSCYWKPVEGNIQDISDTWIFRFLGPTANALSIAVGNLACFTQSMFLLPQVCTATAQKFLGSTVRWAFEIVFRVIGFIEAFVQSFIEQQNTCIGPNCEGTGNGQSYKGVESKPLGNMLVILFSIPVDLLIGDSVIACTTVCPMLTAVPAPPPCYCWNVSPKYNSAGIGSPIYTHTTNSTACLNGQGVHVGAEYLDTTGCCILSAAVPNAVSPLPNCQNPSDVSPSSSAFPGSCAKLSACRPDGLPSIANDPLISYGLAANYVGAVDGIAMGLLRYLMCLLNNLFAPVKFGQIFYPAVLIFSIVWQILGGIIRFLAAIVIFFFSLFTPPNGNGCQCWEHSETDGYNFSHTQYYRNTNGLCYPCRLLGYDCDATHTIGTVVNDDCSKLEMPCADYCPIMQKLRAPTITTAEALSRCISDYQNTTKTLQKKPGSNATQVCTGQFPAYLQVNPFTDNNSTFLRPAITQTCRGLFPSLNTGLCLIQSTSPDNEDAKIWFLHDSCPDPACQINGTLCPGTTDSLLRKCGQTVPGFWNCGGGGGAITDTTYPAGSLVTCGLIQIITNFLDVFASFVAIFTTPLIIPTQRNIAEKNLGSGIRLHGPVVRESFQQFKARYDGLFYGQETPGDTNLARKMTDALYNYDTTDCFTDPIACTCRNLDLKHHCEWRDGQVVVVSNSKRRDPATMTTLDLINIVAEEVFTDNTVCDNLIHGCANMSWSSLSMEDQTMWVDCLDKRIQGSRLHQLAGVFPENFMYDTHSPMTTINNIYHVTRKRMAEATEQRQAARAKRINARKRGEGPDAKTEFERLFPKFQEQLVNRSQFASAILKEKYDIQPHNMMYEVVLKADAIWYKYQTGFYSFALEKTLEGLLSNDFAFLPSTEEAMRDVGLAFDDLKRVIVNQPYREVITHTGEAISLASRYVSDVLQEGIGEHVSKNWKRFTTRADEHNQGAGKMRAERFLNAMRSSPIYKWWYNEIADHPPGEYERRRQAGMPMSFSEHLRTNVINFQREHWQNQNFSFWNADLHFWSAKDILLKRWQNPVWTPEKTENLEKLQRVYYQTYNQIYPGHLDKRTQERFLFLSNCVILDRAVNITVKVIDYCANNYNANVNFTRRARYFENVSPYRPDTYYGWKTRPKFVEEKVVPGDPDSWIGPRWIMPEPVERKSHKVDYRVYRHATRSMPVEPADNLVHGPAGFNLFDWFVGVVEDFTGFAFGAQTDTWFEEIRKWVLNPNTDVQQVPDVGLKYALLFEFRCHFPESINCSIGLGFEAGLWWTIVIFIGIVIVGAFILPPVTLPFQVIGYGICFLLVWGALSWHFPAACLFLFPSFPLPFGVALPTCLMDQLMAFLDKWITNCYSPLLLPAYMIAGSVCPADPTQPIDFLNCRDIGVSDGMQNILFLGVWLFGQTFIDIVFAVTSTVIGTFIPGTREYMETTLNGFKNASPTDMKRMTFCFYATLPSILLPAVFIFLGGIAIALIIPPILMLISALVNLFFTTPAARVVPGGDATYWFGTPSAGPTPTEPETVGQRIQGMLFGYTPVKQKTE